MANNTVVSKKQSLQQLRQNSKLLLSEQEQQYLYHALKEYKTYKSIEKLVRSLLTCLNTTGKLKILKDVRSLVLPNQLPKYDTLIRNAIAAKTLTPQIDRQKINGKVSAQGKYRIVTLLNDKTDLGFYICGGKDSGTGVFVSKVVQHSPAWNAGLLENDHLVEVNGISLQNIPLQSAADLLASLNKLKLVVKEETSAILPSSLEINPWEAKDTRKMNTSNGSVNLNHLKDFSPAEPGFSSLQSSISEPTGSIASQTQNVPTQSDQESVHSVQIKKGTSMAILDSDAKERRLNLRIESNKEGFIGFNIRGGLEYGLGIYVSRVDEGSIAEKSGIKVGDQILDANGKSFENILHEDAVEFFKSNKDVLLTVKAVGKIPAEKCFIEEYSWLAPDGSIITEERRTDYMSSSMPSPMLRDNMRDMRDFGTDPMKFPANETINLPIETLSVSATAEIGTDPIFLHSNGSVGNKEMNAMKFSEIIITSEENLKDELDHRRSPSATSLVSKKSTDSGKSDRLAKSSVHSGEMSDSDRSKGEGTSHLMPNSKAKRSKSFLQKQGDKIKAKFTLRSKKKAAKKNIFDDDPFQKTKSGAREYLQAIEERAKSVLNVNDYKELMKRIKDYLEKGDIELFMTNVLEILDTTEKSLLLKDIRTVVFPYDIGRYDARVSKREIENAISNGGDIVASPILDGEITEVPPKRTLVTAVQGKGGKFRLRSKQEAEEFEKEKEEHTKKISKKYAKQRSILERDITIQRYKSFSNVPRPSPEYTQSWDYEKDDTIGKDLDYIPTKDSPSNLEELYAKVDKSSRKSLNDVVFSKQSEDSVDHANEHQRGLERTMSDIVEDQEYAVLNLNGKKMMDENDNQTATANDDDDDDDYTRISPILDRKREIQEIRVAVPKLGKTLGISISGGRGSTQQPEVRIERIYPGGAVEEVGVLKAGYQIISVDGHPLLDATHNEAVDLIRRSFSDKSTATMELVAVKS
ncbi:PDZ domain-containing protein 7-like [Rhopilema esculentum]|uniref:PDZ domain-containing protein 7-like n=1 Tax=Rhopilema esculentum TaxID=499914 RepID=UPI0031D17D1D|eukprot:gene12394-3052_t